MVGWSLQRRCRQSYSTIDISVNEYENFNHTIQTDVWSDDLANEDAAPPEAHEAEVWGGGQNTATWVLWPHPLVSGWRRNCEDIKHDQYTLFLFVVEKRN